jgi:hypothetical protein
MIAVGLFIRALLSRLLDGFLKIAAFVFEHWRIFLPVAIVALGLWRINALTMQRDDARQIHARHLQADQDAQEKRRVDNTIKYLKAEADQAKLMAEHQSTVATLRIQYETLQGHKAVADRSLGNFRERVRLDTERIATIGLSGILEAAGGSAEGEGNCDAAAIGKAYDTLEIACAMTTADYNALWQAWESACNVYGCK